MSVSRDEVFSKFKELIKREVGSEMIVYMSISYGDLSSEVQTAEMLKADEVAREVKGILESSLGPLSSASVADSPFLPADEVFWVDIDAIRVLLYSHHMEHFSAVVLELAEQSAQVVSIWCKINEAESRCQ